MIDLSSKHFVLATDLDGTFLGGTEAARAALYAWIEARRDTVGLIFVTGRDPDFIMSLTRGTSVPAPDYVVGDVGTTIARVTQAGEVAPMAELEAEIATAWGDAGPRVRAALEGAPGLALQPTAFRYRLSYDMQPAVMASDLPDRIRDMGVDVLVSDNRFFDVLPRGVSKGPSLRRLIAHLGIEERRVLAAGDTMNDFSMLSTGLPAVAVGNSEPALLDALGPASYLHRADGAGAAGIVEAIAAFALHPDIEEAHHAV
ncbi:MAG: HAD-IIB family hydrolase [Pseudomonadota bacterium]